MQACVSGDLDQVKDIFKQCPDLDVHFGFYQSDEGFRMACINGRLDVAKWLVEYASSIDSPIKIRSTLSRRVFEAALGNGYYKLLKWVVKRRREESPDCYDILACSQSMFVEACQIGNLKRAKWLASCIKYVSGYDMHLSALSYLASACQSGNIDIVKWLVGLGKTTTGSPVDFHTVSAKAFISACSNGHIKVAKWLVEYGKSIGSPVNIYAGGRFHKNCQAFTSACFNGHLEVAKWLVHFGGMPVCYSDILETWYTTVFHDFSYILDPVRCFHLGRFSTIALLSLYFRRYVFSFRERYYCPEGKGYEKAKNDFEKQSLLLI